jgi:hypothetical protein
VLHISTGSRARFCDGLHRRDFLRVGALGLGGLTLADLLRSSAAAAGRDSCVKDKSVVLLFLAGGPSQFETFDPKPHGPGTSTSIAGHLATQLPGVRFATYFPKLAELADRLTVVRSFQTNHAEHNGAHKQLLTADLTVQDGKPIKQPGLGAVYARIAGSVSPGGMPNHALIPPTTRHTKEKAGFAGAYDSVVEGSQPAWLGSAYAPFETKVEMAEGKPRSKKKKDDDVPNPLLDNLEPRFTDMQIDGRLGLLRQLDRLNRRIDAAGVMEGVDQYTTQAVDLLRGGAVRKALDVSREDPRTLAAYDTEHFRNYRCGDDSRFDRKGPSIGISLGRQLLLARRLCEAGCGFVTAIHANWDFHARKGIPDIPEGMSVLAPPLDHAVAAFLQDVEQRGLSDKILLVITGEFGRTPGLDKNLGRHHWPGVCPLVLAGGGLRHGQVVGQSDRRGGRPASDPITIEDFHATILHALFDVGKMRLDASLPRKVQQRAQQGKRIEQLFT